MHIIILLDITSPIYGKIPMNIKSLFHTFRVVLYELLFIINFKEFNSTALSKLRPVNAADIDMYA